MVDRPAMITVNGRRVELACENVAALLEHLGYGSDRAGIAVALNGDVVPRRGWAAARLKRGDAVEIVGAVQGG